MVRLVDEWQPAQLVVGIPYNDGPPGPSQLAAEAFAQQLAARTGLPVRRIDERLTSAEAQERLRNQRQAGLRRRRVKAVDVDALAATIIAETWLDLSP